MKILKTIGNAISGFATALLFISLDCNLSDWRFYVIMLCYLIGCGLAYFPTD